MFKRVGGKSILVKNPIVALMAKARNIEILLSRVKVRLRSKSCKFVKAGKKGQNE